MKEKYWTGTLIGQWNLIHGEPVNKDDKWTLNDCIWETKNSIEDELIYDIDYKRFERKRD